jgi:hypothetical protein
MVILMTLISLTVFSQTAAKIDFKTVNKSIRFHPALKELQKEDYYKVELPSYFTYHRSAADVASIFEPYELNIPGLKAKYHIGKAIYFFQVEAQGIINVTSKPNKKIRDEYTFAKGFLKDITYNFPCSLIIKMFDGKEIKTIRKIEITSKEEVLTSTFDMSFSNGTGAFATEEALNNAFNSNQSAIYRTIEKNAFRSAYYQFSDAIGNLFSEFNHGKTPIDIAIVKEKKREVDFTDLDTLTARYRRGIEEFYEGDKKTATEHIGAVAAEYEKMLGSTDTKIDANVKQIAKYNLSFCNVFMGNIVKAEEWLNSIDKNILSAESIAIKELKSFIGIYKIRKNIEDSN